MLLLRLHLQPKQRRLRNMVHAVGPDVPIRLGFGGSRGSAKSRGGRDLALDVAFSFPGVLIYIVARQSGNLEDNYIKKYRVERPELMKYYRASPRPEFNFPQDMGGSSIAFRYADTADDMTALERGPEAYLIIVEQAEQFTEEELQQITKPNRWPGTPRGTCKTVYLFNPGGPGTDYLSRVFYKKVYKENENAADFAFIQAYGWDNWAWFEEACPELTEEEFYALPGEIPECVDEKYDNEWLKSVPNKHRFKIFVTRTSEGQKYWNLPERSRIGDLFGSFSKFAGQYFDLWDERLCVISAKKCEEVIQYWWRAWIGGDLGFGHHTAIFWAAYGKLSPSEAWEHLQIDTEWPIDVLVIYREFLAQRMPEAEIGAELVRMTPEPERKHLAKFVLGSDTKTTDRYALHSRRELIDAVTVPAGMPRIQSAQDGPGSRVINARLMYEVMRRTVVMRGENPPRERPEPKTAPLLLVSAECPALIAAIPAVQSDPDKPDDFEKNPTMADDLIDGAKYVIPEWNSLVTRPPVEVRRSEYVAKGANMQAQYLRHMEFEAAEKKGQVRGRRR